jgi:hypothetical protein
MAARKQKRPRTNVEFVKEMMEFSEYGAMAQLFIIDALYKQAKIVSKSKVEDYPENGFIHPESWIGVATEIMNKIDNRE